MHVAQISFFLDPLQRTSADILRDWWPLVDAAEMAVEAGARVSVIQACSENQELTQRGVSYYFMRPDEGVTRLGASPRFARRLADLRPDVLHVHGLSFAVDVLDLARLAPGVPIYIQDHASRLPPWWRRVGMRRGLRPAAAISFCSIEQSEPFVRAGMIAAHTRVVEMPETSTRFVPGDAGVARRATGVSGAPAVLTVGHLDENKDPLTVLEGVSATVERLPGLQLWCCYGKGPLEPRVRERIASDPLLAGRVHLLGRVPHARIEQMMRAADLFVQGSHREGSGCALVEALACGLPPVVTDIPSFRTLTANGSIGELWPSADAPSLSRALLSVAAQPGLRPVVRAHFESQLSFAAVGRKLTHLYENLQRAADSRTGAVAALRT
jgi:glycosyltransferase involved in cell wall biosynthesis